MTILLRFVPALCFLSACGTLRAQENQILEIIQERPLAFDEFSDEEITQALCWRFGIPPPIVPLDDSTRARYRKLFEQLGSPTFASRQSAQRELIRLLPRPRMLLDWATADADPEVRMRTIAVVRGWKGKLDDAPAGTPAFNLPEVDVIARLPAGVFKLHAMGALQQKNARASNEFYQKQIRMSTDGLNREQRLDCLRLTSGRIQGTKLIPASRNFLTFSLDASEMRDPAWLLEVAAIHSRPDAVFDYRSIQFLERAFRAAPADMDLAPFRALLRDDNPNRHILGAVLGRLGDRKGAELYLQSLQQNTTMQRYAYAFTGALPPDSLPDPKAAQTAFAKLLKAQAKDLEKRYGSAPEYLASQYARMLSPLKNVPEVHEELRTLARTKTSPLRLYAALALRHLTGRADRELLGAIRLEDGPVSIYLESGSETLCSTHTVNHLVTEILNDPDPAPALEDLNTMFHLLGDVLKQQLATSPKSSRRHTFKRNIDTFCYTYQNVVLPLGIDLDLEDTLLELGSYQHKWHDAHSLVAMMAAAAEARVGYRVEALVDTVLSRTNVIDALYLLSLTERKPDRIKQLYRIKRESLSILRPVPPPLRAALQVADPPTLYEERIQFVGSIPGLCSVNLQRFGLKALPEPWLKDLPAPSAQLIRYCQDPTRDVPAEALPIDKEHLEAVLSLAQRGVAPEALVDRAFASLPEWLIASERASAEIYTRAKNLHRLSLLGAKTGRDLSPTDAHPKVRASGWLLEARRRTLIGDAQGAVSAWDALERVHGAILGTPTGAAEEAWIARWLAGGDKKQLRLNFADHALTGAYTGSEIIEFLLGEQEWESVLEVADEVMALPGEPSSFRPALNVAWVAAEQGKLELAATFAAQAYHRSKDAETLQHAALLQQWLAEPPSGFPEFLKLSAAGKASSEAYAELAEQIEAPELKALVAWRGAGVAWREDKATRRAELLALAPADTLFGGFAELERNARPPEETRSMITTDTLSDEPFARRVRPDFSRIGLTKKPSADPEHFHRVLFLDERGIPLLDGAWTTVNTAWGLWLSHIDSRHRYRSGRRHILAAGDGFSEAHLVDVLPWSSLMDPKK